MIKRQRCKTCNKSFQPKGRTWEHIYKGEYYCPYHISFAIGRDGLRVCDNCGHYLRDENARPMEV